MSVSFYPITEEDKVCDHVVMGRRKFVNRRYAKECPVRLPRKLAMLYAHYCQVMHPESRFWVERRIQ